MEVLTEFIKSLLAGIMISIGCIVNLSCDNKYIGSLLFCVGLVTILLYGFNLYTGKVCYIPNNKPSYIGLMAIVLIGNIVACVVMGMLFPITPTTLCDAKLNNSICQVLLKSTMCGLMIYISVESYKTHKTLLPTFLCVPTFILSGYIHVVADSFYFASANIMNIEVIKYLAIATIGNAIGGMFIPCINKLNSTKLIEKEK